MKKQANQTISVIIPTRNRAKEVVDCLESIKLQTLKPDEIIIVDSSDNDSVKKELSKFNVKLLKIKYFYIKTAGGPYQRNFGAEKSKGDIILFSDDDTIWSKNYLEEIKRVFNEKKLEEIGGVTSNPIIKRKNSKQKLTALLNNVFSSIFLLTREGNGKFQISGMATTFGKDVKEIKKCEFLYGFSMAFRREVFLKFRFDEKCGGYAWNDDDDIAYRVSKEYNNYFTPFAKVIHTMPRRNKKIDGYTHTKRVIIYHHYFFKKNLPKTILYIIAFWWSIIGLIIKNSLIALIKKDYHRIRGLIDGIKEII